MWKLFVLKLKEKTTALGAAYLAGLAVGFWKGKKIFKKLHSISTRYHPQMSNDERDQYYDGWK